MSEYQYYEFQAVDRPLTAKEMATLRGFSSRATITPTRFVNSCSYGSFKGDPSKWIEEYFDAFLYLSNWGTRELFLRRQKVKALTDRREVQARDVFDLGSVLIPRVGGRTEELRSVRASLEEAMNRAMTLTYAEYKAQVVAYLHPDHAEALGSSEAWDAMQLQVVEFLDKAIALERRRGQGR